MSIALASTQPQMWSSQLPGNVNFWNRPSLEMILSSCGNCFEFCRALSVVSDPVLSDTSHSMAEIDDFLLRYFWGNPDWLSIYCWVLPITEGVRLVWEKLASINIRAWLQMPTQSRPDASYARQAIHVTQPRQKSFQGLCHPVNPSPWNCGPRTCV